MSVHAYVDEDNNMLVRLNDCNCDGYNQTYECTIFGAGITIWQGTVLSGCQQFINDIRLRHSAFMNSQAT